jgi:CRP-like cAMP-binding protein
MVSPELLRRYPFFGGFDEDELKAIAMLSDEVTVEGGVTLFETGQPAANLYLLLEGEVELHYDVADPVHTEYRKDFFIEDFNPGEPFGISAVLEPYVYLGRVEIRSRSRLLRMDGPRLRELCEIDSGIGPVMMRQIAKAAISRLTQTRVLLAAARAAE